MRAPIARAAALAIAAAMTGLAAPPAEAQPRARRAVVVRVDGELAARLAERLRGQLSDYEVDVVVSAADRIEDRLAAQIASAGEAAAGREGAMVAWVARAAGTPHVYLLDVRERRVFVRATIDEGSDPDRFGSSVDIERAALILRTAVSAVLAGADVGVSEQEALADEPVEPAPVEEAPSPPCPDGPPRAERPASFWRLGLGWRAGVDGVSPPGAHAASLSVEHAIAPLIAGARLEGGVPIELGDARAVVRLSRHAALLHVGARVALADGLVLELGLAAGGAAYLRETVSAAPPLSGAAPRWTPTPMFAGFARLSVALTGWLVALVGGGLDVVPAAPIFALEQEGGGTSALAQVWPVSPHLEIALAFVIVP